MQKKFTVMFVGGLLISLLAFLASATYDSEVQYTDITFYAWITNMSNETITDAPIQFQAWSNSPLNMTEHRIVTEGIVTNAFTDDKTIGLVIGEIKPNCRVTELMSL